MYYTTLGNDLAEAQAEKDKLAEALKPIMAQESEAGSGRLRNCVIRI